MAAKYMTCKNIWPVNWGFQRSPDHMRSNVHRKYLLLNYNKLLAIIFWQLCILPITALFYENKEFVCPSSL